MRHLSPTVKVPSRQTLREYVAKAYVHVIGNMKKAMDLAMGVSPGTGVVNKLNVAHALRPFAIPIPRGWV